MPRSTVQQRYDTCFNTWFASYLPLASSPDVSDDERKVKADEYESKCGQTFREYKACLQASRLVLFSRRRVAVHLLFPFLFSQKGIQEKGLTDLLAQARAEEPLASYHGVEWPLEDDPSQRQRQGSDPPPKL
jgi:hypothetical protein